MMKHTLLLILRYLIGEDVNMKDWMNNIIDEHYNRIEPDVTILIMKGNTGVARRITNRMLEAVIMPKEELLLLECKSAIRELMEKLKSGSN